MKKFSQFISEARTQAGLEAQKKGLHHVGRGYYADNSGQVVAKSENGVKLTKVSKQELSSIRQKVAQQTLQQPSGSEQSQGNTQQQSQQSSQDQQQSQQQDQQPEQLPMNTSDKKITITFGRFNPPTIGHKKLLDRAKAISKGGDFLVFPSRSHDPKKNPLSPAVKIDFMRQMFPKYADNIVDDSNAKTIFDVLIDAQEQGYTDVTLVVGADRLKEFENLAMKYNGELYNFNSIEVLSAGDRDAESEGVEGMSASKLRKFAAAGDYDSFVRGVPKELDDESVDKLFKILRKSMNIKEGVSLWEIAPKLDYYGLRENYVNGYVFEVGDVVQNDNTGLCGEIIRAGANHVIAITEDGIMFKSWIKDISEVFTNVSGVPADQRLVGTDAYREYVRRLTPPKEAILNFINNSRKSRTKTGNVR